MKAFSTSRFLFGIYTVLASLFVLSSCSKELSLENVNNSLAAGTWQFSEGNSNFMGNIDTAFIKKGATINEMHFLGTSKDGSQTFNLVLYADTFKTGIYKASLFQASFNYTSGNLNIYDASQVNGEFTVTLTSVSATTVTGIFSGKALKLGESPADISSGSFSAIFKTPIQKPQSNGTLSDNAGNCMPATINGTYKQGIPINPGNTIIVQVAVTKAGTYTITTDAANGVSFSASGEFTTTGLQSVTLTGNGIPVNSGNVAFTLHYGTSLCGFTINFAQGAAASQDYYPTSNNSYWTYNDGINDYTYKVAPNLLTVAGKVYAVIMQQTDTVHAVRKAAGLYYDYLNYQKAFSLSTPLHLETIFLKDNVAAGTTWDGPDFTNGGNTFHLKYTLLEKAVPALVGIYNFPDVIKVQTDLYSGNTFVMSYLETWYAKNAGMVYQKDKVSGKISTIKDYRVY